jgi:F-type H+-transporting ATPase subunit a
MILTMNLALLIAFCNSLFFSFYSTPSRLSCCFSLFSSFSGSLFSLFTLPVKALLGSLFMSLLFLNIFSSLPFSRSFSLYYFFTFVLSVSFWVSSFFRGLSSNLPGFISHLMPYGSPMFLSLILPLIEIFSQLIRPFTLMVRLRTNLSAGHIILFMFSLFSMGTLSSILPLFIFRTLLIILELAISALQAYIFVSLARLYISETL